MIRIGKLLRGLLLAGATAAHAAPPLRVERIVLVMRHGVRPPTKAPPMPTGVAAEPWPAWDVPPGNLTAHGAAAIRLLGADDRRRFAALLPRGGCPAAGMVLLRSDSDQRTIATGDAWAAGLAPGCTIANDHKPQGEDDPLFRAAGENGEPFDAVKADHAIAAVLGPAGISGRERAEAGALARLDAILCGDRAEACGVQREATGVTPARPGQRPKLSGALDRGSTAAQILLLEYAEGKPAAEVGWGRASAADIANLSRLHAAEFAILARPPYLAATNASPLARSLRDLLGQGGGPRLAAFVGHDTNVASLGGLLGLHWQAQGFAADDPPPGGALQFELLRGKGARRYVRVTFRSQGLDAMRALSPHPIRPQPLKVAGCAALCPLADFTALVDRALALPR